VTVVKRIACLANSRKLNGRCVAGKESIDGRPASWIRPVSAREHEAVSEYERQYPDGSDPRVLDIMDVPLIEPRPKDYQQENWLLDPEHYWEKVGSAGWRDLDEYVDPEGPLWINGQSTYNGLNDKVDLSSISSVHSSLRVVRVDRLRFVVFKPGEAFGNPKRRVQGQFRHHGTDYWLWVTDPSYERVYLARSDGSYDIGNAFLTISLGEPHKGAAYKLIAAVIEREGGQA
jgi:hypothetical protein